MQARLPLQWRSVIHPDDLTTVMAEAEAAAAEKRAFEAEYRLLRADGVYRWHLGRSVVVSDSEGRPLRKIGSATDIHEQRESRELIRALKQRTDAIIQDAPILLWAVDTAGIVTYYDGKVKKILGIRTEDRIGTNLIDLYRTRPEVAENIRRALRGEIVSDESKIGDICLENKFSPQYDTAGVINGVVGLSVDITERKRAEHERTEATARAQSAIETSRLKSEFLANMSHEIRTPLNGVLGMSGLLLDTSLTPDQREFTSAIQRSGENLLTLINDILDFSKIEAGRLDLEDCPFDLREVFTDLEKAMGFAVRAKNLRLSVEIDPRLPAQVSGDGGRLRQVLLNLVGNAIKFTTFGAVTVTIRAGESTGARTGIRVDVVDTGIGIPADTLGNLFRPFTQADASMARRYGGSGLGLSISKGLVERMGGEIGAVSQVGSGSRFWFTGFFGIVDAEMEIAPSTPAPARTDFTGVRVLVADDIVMNQVLAVRTLEKYGFRVDVVGNGVEVLEALRTLPYDLILMDCQMPEMDGYQATTAIRESASLPNPNIPIIAMTANAMRGDSEKCIASGMDDYVSKPVKPAALPRGHRAPTHRQKTRPLRIAGSLVVSRHQLKLSSSPPFARPPRLSSPGSGGCGKPRLYLRFQMNADPVGGMRIFYVEVDGFCSDDSGCRAFDDVFCNRRVRRSETRGLFADRRRERVAHGRNRIYSLGSEKPRHPTQIFGRSTKTRKSDQGDPRLHRPKSRSDHTRSRRRNGLGTSASRSESGAHSGDPRRSGASRRPMIRSTRRSSPRTS